MDMLFVTILNMSLTASFVTVAIIAVRQLLKKAPKVISYALWLVAGFRLVFPFSFESVFSLIPFERAPIPTNIALQTMPRVDSGIRSVDTIVNTVLPVRSTVESVNPLQIWMLIGAYLWLTGIIIMLVYSIISMFRLKHNLKTAIFMEDNIYEVQGLKSPFVVGLLQPKIYLPVGLTEEERHYVLLHEQTHIRRYDHVVKFIAYFILCLHWFNPLVWIAFLLMAADMEMSCDEQVLRILGKEHRSFGNLDLKKDYSLSILSLATEGKIIGGSPLAFGEGRHAHAMKERIKNILKFKKTSHPIVIIAVMLLIVLSIGFAADRPRTKEENLSAPDIVEDELSHIADGYDAEALSTLETPYVGNNSKVSKIVSHLLLPDSSLKQQFISIGDDYGSGLAPYTLTVYYEPQETGVDMKLIGPAFRDTNNRNATLLFALIDNLKEVSFAIRYSPTEDNQLNMEEYKYRWCLAREDSSAYNINDWRQALNIKDKIESHADIRWIDKTMALN